MAKPSVRVAPVIILSLVLCGAILVSARAPGREFRFCILGDRTGETVPGVYEEAWREAALDRPDFVINVGDTIQGRTENSPEDEWRVVEQTIARYQKCPLFLVPGNHDVWSPASAQAFARFSKHQLHYSFDFENAHFTVLDNSESEDLAPAELVYLEEDLRLHSEQPLKLIFMHRPSWVVPVLLQNPNFPLHQLARRYGVQYVIAGHIHQMLRFDLDGITYVSFGSSGGHLREQKDYAHGWFFQHTLAEVKGNQVQFNIKELDPPFGQARVTTLSDWGSSGLQKN